MFEMAKAAGIQEVSPRKKLSRRKVTPHILRHRPAWSRPDERRAPAYGPEAGGAQEAVHHGDLRHRGPGAGEGGLRDEGIRAFG